MGAFISTQPAPSQPESWLERGGGEEHAQEQLLADMHPQAKLSRGQCLPQALGTGGPLPLPIRANQPQLLVPGFPLLRLESAQRAEGTFHPMS